MKTIFITGASTGLGRATAVLFAAKGWKVIATMRTPEKETELAAMANVTLMQLDVTNAEQVTEVEREPSARRPGDPWPSTAAAPCGSTSKGEAGGRG